MMLLKQTLRRSYVFDRSQKVSPRGFPCCSVEVIATYLVCEMMEGKSTRPGCGGKGSEGQPWIQLNLENHTFEKTLSSFPST